jgi:hypothetical protein
MQGSEMGKVITVYLSDEETRHLKDFCDENQCTQYSALKTAVRQLLFRPLDGYEEDEPSSYTDRPVEETQDKEPTIEEQDISEQQTERAR